MCGVILEGLFLSSFFHCLWVFFVFAHLALITHDVGVFLQAFFY
jgi:hypothetical protein